MVVFPLLSSPMMMILSYFFPDSLVNNLVKKPPIARLLGIFKLIFIINPYMFLSIKSTLYVLSVALSKYILKKIRFWFDFVMVFECLISNKSFTFNIKKMGPKKAKKGGDGPNEDADKVQILNNTVQ